MLYAGVPWKRPSRLAPEGSPFFAVPGGSLGELSDLITEVPLNGRLAGLGCGPSRECDKCSGARLDQNRRSDLSGLRGGLGQGWAPGGAALVGPGYMGLGAAASASVEAAQILMGDIETAYGDAVGSLHDQAMAAVNALGDGVDKNYLQTIGIAVGNEMAELVSDFSDEDNAAATQSLARMYAQLQDFVAGTLAQDTVAHGGLTASEHADNVARMEAAKNQARVDQARFCANPVNKVLIPELWNQYDCKLPIPDVGGIAKVALIAAAAIVALGLYGRARG